MKKHLVILAWMGLCSFTAQAQDAAPAFPSVQAREQERHRLDEMRNTIETTYKQDKKACYQKFDVNDCLLKAREVYIQANSAWRKQELSYQDTERNIKNKEAADRLAEKNSEANQQQAAQQRQQSVQDAQQRRQENARKQIDHEAQGNKREQYEQKQKEALEHRQNVANQIAQRGKPASAPLPLPAGATP